jgi:hypothetical protein
LGARGLMTYLQSQPEEWGFNAEQIIGVTNERDLNSLPSLVGELVAVGYLDPAANACFGGVVS